MASTVISNRQHAGKGIGTKKDAGKSSRRPAGRRRSSPAPALRRPAPAAQRAAKGQRTAPEREKLLEYARRLLEPLSSLEMLCEADEKMENAIFYMNRAATEAMNLNHKRLNPLLQRSRRAQCAGTLDSPVSQGSGTNSQYLPRSHHWHYAGTQHRTRPGRSYLCSELHPDFQRRG